jgi:hypothetical protein
MDILAAIDDSRENWHGHNAIGSYVPCSTLVAPAMPVTACE